MISIVFFHNNSTNIFSRFFSSLIQWLEGHHSQISHVAIGLQIDNRPYLLQANWPSIQLIPRSNETSTHTVIAEFQVVPDITGEVAAAQKRIGQPYDILTLLGYIPVLLARHLGIGVDNPFYSKSGAVCSEFVIEVDAQHQIRDFDGLDPANIDPEKLFEICSNGHTSFKLLPQP